MTENTKNKSIPKRFPFPKPTIGPMDPLKARCACCEQPKLKGSLNERGLCGYCATSVQPVMDEIQRERDQTRLRLEKMVSLTRQKKFVIPAMGELLGELFAHRGGVKKFAEQWSDQLNQAIENRPGSKMVLDQFAAIAKMLGVVGDQIQESVNELSDKELAEELLFYAQDAIGALARPGSYEAESEAVESDDQLVG